MGRVYKATYTVKGPDGQRITKTAPGFYIEWTDGAGRTRHQKAALKESEAKDALRKAEGDVLKE